MDRCSLCPGRNACIPSDGPADVGGVLFIGEAPGKMENDKRRVFIGKTGVEVDEHYLPLAGLRRSTVTVTNAIKCLPVSSGGKLDPNRTADIELLQSCAEAHLYQEIRRMKPRLLVPMGNFACKALDPEINLEVEHGFPKRTSFGPAFPMYHPALGLHSPKQMLYIREDWERLGKHLKRQLRVPADEYPEPDYAEVTDPREIDALDPTIPIGCDTESSRRHGPYFLTFSQRAGSGRLIRASRADLLARFVLRLHGWESVILFHNWLYDARIVADMGLRFPASKIRDTMLLAYHLGNLPQGLKALAWRELGMLMQDFDDLVTPYSVPHVIDYYRRMLDINWPKPEPYFERDSKTGKWKPKAPHSLTTKLKTFFTNLGKNPEKDVFGAWDNWESEHEAIEAQCGPFPGKDIALVPFEKALHYACRDSDALVRLYPHLLTMRRRMMQGYPVNEWRAA